MISETLVIMLAANWIGCDNSHRRCEQAHIFSEIAKRKTMRSCENSVELLLTFRVVVMKNTTVVPLITANERSCGL